MTPAQAEALIENLFPDYVIADLGYDAASFCSAFEEKKF